jgi:hypothetical protein
MPIQEQNFHTRLVSSGEDTDKCIAKLLETNHILSARKTTLDRDKDDGVDFDFDYDKEKNISNQFKIRHNHPDIPIVIAQPFWGNGHEKTRTGRDLNCLLNKQTKYHYVGIVKNGVVQSIFYAKSSAVSKEAVAALKIWYKMETDTVASQYGKNWFTPEMTKKWIAKVPDRRIFSLPNGVEIWWKKNRSERYGKLNLYVPCELVKGVVVYEC